MASKNDSLVGLVDQLTTRCPQLHLLKMLSAGSEADFDSALEDLLEAAVVHLEKNARYLANCNENAITAFLIAYLNMPGFLRALQEDYSKGHVDITIEAEPALPLRRRLGEAKIFRGPSNHVKGLSQLVNRYSTGREGTGILIEYVKKDGIKALVDKIRKHMDKVKPCEQDGGCKDHRLRWAFSTRHGHISGELLNVLHVNCNLAVVEDE